MGYKYRERVKDSFAKFIGLQKTPRPHADNSKVITEYSKGMLKLLQKKYNSGKKLLNHNISTKGFFARNKGAIHQMFLEFDNFLRISNTSNVNKYREFCKKNNLPAHPARMPPELAEFFIRFLTKKKSLVLDPFAGSNTTGYVASKLNRKWISIEKNLDYIKGSQGWFN